MQRRLAKLDATLAPAPLRQMATEVAAAAGLDPALVLAEAEAMLKRCAGRSLPEIAAQEGIELAELEAMLMRRQGSP